MKIIHVVISNKEVVYLLSLTKLCILDLFTLFYERLIQTISCVRGLTVAKKFGLTDRQKWVDVRDNRLSEQDA